MLNSEVKRWRNQKKIGKALTFKMKIELKIQLFGVVAFWLSKWKAINFVKHSSIAGGFVGLVGPNWSMWSLQFGVVRRKTISARASRPVHLSEFGLWSTALERISLPLKFKVWTAMLMSSPSFCFSTLSPPPAVMRCKAKFAKHKYGFFILRKSFGLEVRDRSTLVNSS